MGDLRYNEFFSRGNSGKQHPVISLKQYSEGLLAYEREKEKESPSTKSYITNWKKKIILNCIGEPTRDFYYSQKSVCRNIKDLRIRTIINYSLNRLCFSIHLPETDNLIKQLNNQKGIKVKVQLLNKNFNYSCDGTAIYDSEFCIYPIITIPIDIASRYLQKSESWTCRIHLLNYFYEFNLTGNLPPSWS